MHIIGISGLKGSGKTTSANYIQEKYTLVSIAFADAVKRIACELFEPDFDWSHALFGSSSRRTLVHTKHLDSNGQPIVARNVLRELGEAGRRISPDVWICKLFSIAEDLYDSRGLGYESNRGVFSEVDAPRWRGVVISDVRYRNEFDAVRIHGGKILRLKRGMSEASDMHASEAEQLSIPDSEFDYVIDNSELTLDELKSELDRFAGKFNL